MLHPERQLHDLLASRLNFKKHPAMEEFLVSTKPYVVTRNPTLSPKAIHEVLHSRHYKKDASERRNLLYRYPLEEDDIADIVNTEKRVTVLEALLTSQSVTSQQVLSLLKRVAQPRLCSIVAENFRAFGFREVPLIALEHASPEIRFKALLHSKPGTYSEWLLPWLQDFSACRWRQNNRQLAWAHLVSQRPDTLEALRVLSKKDATARAALCLSGLVHDERQQLADLGLDEVLGSRGTTNYENARAEWYAKNCLLARAVATNPFTRKSVRNMLQTIFGISPGQVRLGTLLTTIDEVHEVLCDPSEVTDRLVRDYVNEWYKTAVTFGFHDVLSQAMKPLLPARKGEWSFILKNGKESLAPHGLSAASDCQKNGQRREQRDRIFASRRKTTTATRRHRLGDCLLYFDTELLQLIEASFADNVELYKTLLALSASWDASVGALLDTVMNLQ